MENIKQLNGMWFDVVHGMVNVWYPDGDQCARIYDNLGLGIAAEDVAQFICDAINAYAKPAVEAPPAPAAAAESG